MRICSLLPSATEIVGALGLADSLVGVSYECDYPPEVKEKPVVVHTRLSLGGEPEDVDREVREFLARGESLYRVDESAFEDARPDLVLTQELCHICAATPGDLGSALSALENEPRVLTLHPHGLDDVLHDILEIGAATGSSEEATRLVSGLRERLDVVTRKIDGASRRPRAFCLEWVEPPMVGGHWVAEMVELAGGLDVLGDREKPSFRVEWQDVLDRRPEVVVVMPCGYGPEAAAEEYRRTTFPEGWAETPAVRDGRVFAVDANSFFSRPGPRLVRGVEILASMFHPDLCGNALGDDEVVRLETPRDPS